MKRKVAKIIMLASKTPVPFSITPFWNNEAKMPKALQEKLK